MYMRSAYATPDVQDDSFKLRQSSAEASRAAHRSRRRLLSAQLCGRPRQSRSASRDDRAERWSSRRRCTGRQRLLSGLAHHPGPQSARSEMKRKDQHERQRSALRKSAGAKERCWRTKSQFVQAIDRALVGARPRPRMTPIVVAETPSMTRKTAAANICLLAKLSTTGSAEKNRGTTLWHAARASAHAKEPPGAMTRSAALNACRARSGRPAPRQLPMRAAAATPRAWKGCAVSKDRSATPRQTCHKTEMAARSARPSIAFVPMT